MFSENVMALLKEVITSWQVIAVTVVLILYLNIVLYAARAYHAPRLSNRISFKRKKPKQDDILAPSDSDSSDSSANDELGLEEE